MTRPVGSFTIPELSLTLAEGQPHYWPIDETNVGQLPAELGVEFPGWEGKLRPYDVDGAVITALDEHDRRRGIYIPFAPGDPRGIEYFGEIPTPDGPRPVVRFPHYKEDLRTGEGEALDRVAVIIGVGYGVLMPGHKKERAGFYFEAYDAARAERGGEVRLADISDLDPSKLRRFSLARMGFFGDLNDAEYGEQRRAYWGIDYVPEPESV